MANLVITIDGPAASGKSTVARLLAQRLDAGFLDTGAMYRAVTLAAMRAGVDLNNPKQLLGVLENSDFEFSIEAAQITASIDGEDVTEQIRQPEVTKNAHYIASTPDVRQKLVQMQREFADKQKKIVTEGRDQGTVAFGDANYKFFLTADPLERAKRRHAELKTKGIDESLNNIRKAIEQRDQNDQNRTTGPLKPADDAILVDTTNLGIEQVVEKLLDYISTDD